MTLILLTGAGFSRNWRGWLASEAFEYVLQRWVRTYANSRRASDCPHFLTPSAAPYLLGGGPLIRQSRGADLSSKDIAFLTRSAPQGQGVSTAAGGVP
jgi:hypothetical protein